MLKNILTLFLITFSFIVGAKEYPESFYKAEQILEYFDENPDVVWPGFTMSDMPIIVHEGTPLVLAFGLNPNSPEWKPANEFQRDAWINSQDLQNLHDINFHPSYNVDGQNAYIYNLFNPMSSPSRTYQAFVHEKFHQFQFQRFAISQTGVFEDHLNVEIQRLIYLENQALYQLLNDLQSINKMKDVVAVYNVRRTYMSKNSLDWEKWQTRMEGSAEYVNTKTFIELPILDISPILILKDYSNRNFGFTADSNVVDAAIKWRYYSVGGIAGLALDSLNYDWKERVAAGESPLDILADYFNLSQNETQKRFKKIAEKWDDPEQEQKILVDIDAYEAALNEIQQDFDNSPGLDLQLNVKTSCPSGNITEKTYYLSSGGTVAINITGTEDCQMDDQIYRKDFKVHPIAYSLKDGYRVKVDTTEIKLDGESYEINDLPSTGSFEIVEINSATFNLFYSGKVNLSRIDDRVVISSEDIIK